VRVGEEQEAIEEASRCGRPVLDCGARFREEQKLCQRGVERVEVAEASTCRDRVGNPRAYDSDVGAKVSK
jgi:hypothetical protein